VTLISLDVLVERHPGTSLPRYAVLPRALLSEHGIDGKVTVRGSLNGVAFEGRNIHPWDDERFFMNLPQPLCRKAGVEVGDTATLAFEPIRNASA
jgi:hypothetical protein